MTYCKHGIKESAKPPCEHCEIDTLKAQLEVVSRERDEFCALWKARTDDVDELKQQIAELQKENTELKSERIKFLRNAYVMVGRILRVEGENEQLKEWREGFLSERTGV